MKAFRRMRIGVFMGQEGAYTAKKMLRPTRTTIDIYDYIELDFVEDAKTLYLSDIVCILSD